MGRRAQLIWSPQAKRDLKAIFTFYAPEEISKAKEIVSTIAAQAARLEYLPDTGKPARGVSIIGIRELVWSNYRIFYRRESDCVHILTVWHSARRGLPNLRL